MEAFLFECPAGSFLAPRGSEHEGVRFVDFGADAAALGKGLRHLPQLHRVMNGINNGYLAIQQDVLETLVDRGELARLRQPTITRSGRRTPVSWTTLACRR